MAGLQYLLPQLGRLLRNMNCLNQQNSLPLLYTGGIRHSSSQKMVEVSVDDKTGVATLVMQRPPVNSLNLGHMQQLVTSLKELQAKKCPGVIITSSLRTIFSAGLDITELYKPKPESLRSFWSTFQDMWHTLYGSPMATVALINGHAPAGGCVIASSCDYRVMVAGQATIGLNETQLGIVAPFWVQEVAINLIGHREAERSLQLGLLFSAEEAYKIGLVNEVAANKQEAEEKAKQQMATLLKIPSRAREKTKLMVRQPVLDHLMKAKEEDIEHFVEFCTSPQVQKGLELYLQSLKAKVK